MMKVGIFLVLSSRWRFITHIKYTIAPFVFFNTAPKGKIPVGGDVWVLLIRETKPSDSDLYVCEVNSDPPIKSFHPLKGKSRSTLEFIRRGCLSVHFLVFFFF